MAFMPVYIEKSGDLVGCYHSRTDGQTNEQTRKDRATQPMDHGRPKWAIHIENIWKVKVKVKESLLTIGLRGTGSAWHPRRRVRAPTLHLNILKNWEDWPPRYPVDYIFSRWEEEPTWLLTVKMWQISWSWLVKVLIMWKIWPWWDFCKTFGKHITVCQWGWTIWKMHVLFWEKKDCNLLASEPLVLNWLGGEYDDGNAPIFY